MIGLGEKFIDAGEHMIADIPFDIARPEDITLERILIIDINRQPININEIEIIYELSSFYPVRLYSISKLSESI